MLHKLSDKLFHHKEKDPHKPAVVTHSEKDLPQLERDAGVHHVENDGIEAHDTVVKPAIVEEKLRADKVIEVQPIIHKEVERNVVHHVTEHVIEPAAPNIGGTVRNPPIVEEHIHTRVIDEIQPIIHREVAVPRVEKVEEHITEHVVAPTVHTHEVKETIVKPATMHVSAGGPPPVHNDHKHL